MKIVFFGTPYFAAKNLQHLINNEQDIVAVVTPPDSKTGRGKKIKACAVKELGLQHKLKILQPEKLKANSFINELKNLNADIFIVVAFRMLPKLVWEIPPKGSINLHTSLLPNYKGAAPINWVLINGEKETGVSTFFINHEIDSGAIILQEKVTLNEETTAAQLHNILIQKGNSLILRTLKDIQNNTVKLIPQKHKKPILEAPKLTKELLKIDWNKSATDIHNLIRGLSPLLEKTYLENVAICPSAWFLLENSNGKKKRIKIHLTSIIKSGTHNMVSINTDNKEYLHITTKKDTLSILNLQMEGKKPMTIKQFLQGNKINANYKIL